MPIVLIATLATFLVAVGFITTGELLAGNVYRPAYGEAEAVVAPVAEPAPIVAAESSAFHATAADRFVPPDVPELEPVPEPERPSPPPTRADVPASPAAPAGAATGAPVGSTDRLASELRRAGDAGKRISVVGVARNVGTTSAAIALARALSQQGRVVLVDLSLNAPNIAAISVDPGAPGIAELMRGTASFRHIITRDRSSRVHLVAAGRVPADASSILRSERLTIALERAGAHLRPRRDRRRRDAAGSARSCCAACAACRPGRAGSGRGCGHRRTGPARRRGVQRSHAVQRDAAAPGRHDGRGHAGGLTGASLRARAHALNHVEGAISAL